MAIAIWDSAAHHRPAACFHPNGGIDGCWGGWSFFQKSTGNKQQTPKHLRVSGLEPNFQKGNCGLEPIFTAHVCIYIYICFLIFTDLSLSIFSYLSPCFMSFLYIYIYMHAVKFLCGPSWAF